MMKIDLSDFGQREKFPCTKQIKIYGRWQKCIHDRGHEGDCKFFVHTTVTTNPDKPIDGFFVRSYASFNDGYDPFYGEYQHLEEAVEAAINECWRRRETDDQVELLSLSIYLMNGEDDVWTNFRVGYEKLKDLVAEGGPI